MGCLVAGLLALGMLGVLVLIVIVFAGASGWDLIVAALLIVLGVVGLFILERGWATMKLARTVALAFILFFGALVVLVGIPAFLQYNSDPRRGLCINNMRLIDHAKDVLAIKNDWTNGQVIADTPEAIWEALDPYIDGTNFLWCPETRDKHYIYGAIGVTPRCPVADTYTEHVYQPD